MPEAKDSVWQEVLTQREGTHQILTKTLSLAKFELAPLIPLSDHAPTLGSVLGLLDLVLTGILSVEQKSSPRLVSDQSGLPPEESY